MNKLIILFAVVALSLGACKKDTTCSNTVTVTDGGTYYSVCGNFAEVSAGQQILAVNVVFYKGSARSFLKISGVGSPFSINLEDSTNVNGVGDYTLPTTDSNNNYTDYYHGGQSYKCSGGTLSVTHCDASIIAGSYTMNIFNAAGSRTISGTFNAIKPEIFSVK